MHTVNVSLGKLFNRIKLLNSAQILHQVALDVLRGQFQVSLPRENVLLVPNRNVLLTGRGWGGGVSRTRWENETIPW